jgi:hypothetical protein
MFRKTDFLKVFFFYFSTVLQIREKQNAQNLKKNNFFTILELQMNSKKNPILVNSQSSANIQILLKKPKTEDPEIIYKKYLKKRKKNAEIPSYFVDFSQKLFENNQKNLGIRVLSSLAEIKLKNPQFLRFIIF